MSYKELKITKYNDYHGYNDDYIKRFDGYATLKTNLKPYLMHHKTLSETNLPMFVVNLPEISLLSEKIIANSREIDKISSKLPGVARHQFYNEKLSLAIQSTDEIEGIKTTREEINSAKKAVLKNATKKVRLQSTVKLYQDIIENKSLHITTFEDVRSIYDELTEGEIDKKNLPDGSFFRNEEVFITDERSGDTVHNPPMTGKAVSDMMSEWLLFINNSKGPFLIKALIGHYFFENVHPFYDGNGRIGRYILSKYLSRKLDIYTGLGVSQFLNENRRAYYKAFAITGEADNKAEGTFFVLALLNIIYEGQQNLIDDLKFKKVQLSSAIQKIELDTTLSEVERTVLVLLAQSKLFTESIEDKLEDRDIIAMAKETSHSQNAVQKAIKELEEQGKIDLLQKRPLIHDISNAYI
ncbi:Fic family protein [Pseudolactococcus yaeyamensis]